MVKTIKINLRVAIYFLLTAFYSVINAQPKQLQFRYLTPKDGLSSSEVTCIMQDHRGFMWIGTYEGLNRYDGYNFTVYKNINGNAGSLACDQVHSIYEDRQGNLLVGTDCGLSQYNPDNDNFINYMSEDSSALYGLYCNVYNIVEDSVNNLWLSTDTGLIYFDRQNNKSVIYKHHDDDPTSLSNDWLDYVFLDSRNRLWVSTRSGLNLFHPSTGVFEHITHGENPNEDFSGVSFLEIAEDYSGNIWIASFNGLYCIKNSDTENRTLTWFHHDQDDPYSISASRLLGLFIDKDNNLWVGAENGGLFLFDRTKNRFWHYMINDYDPGSLNNESIQDVYVDNSGNLWVGTFGGGLDISPENSEWISHYENLKGGEKSLGGNVVSAFIEDHNKQIWVGTDGGGLNLFNENTKLFTRFNKGNSNLTSNSILSIVEDDNNNLWMATWGGGIVKFNLSTKKFTPFTTQNSKIPDDNIFSVARGDNHDLWLGSFTHGLIHYRIDKNIFTDYTTDNSTIGNNYVFVVKKSPDGLIYMGTTSGLKTYSPKENKFTIYMPVTKNPYSLSSRTIYDLLYANDTCIWIATQDGLDRFNPETGKFFRYYQKDGLPDNVIKGLVFDQSGNLWVTTDNGICRFDYKHHQYDIYTQDDGLQSNEFEYKSAMLSDRGGLFLGGVNGFNIIYPKQITENPNVPKVNITGLSIFNKPVKPDTPGSPLKKVISETREITLSYKQSFLTFYFAVMDFTRPKKNQYAYMLENFDKDWTYSGSKREATYTNLDPGTYIFRVRGSNNDEIWNNEGASLKITILPPWWSTLMFRIVVLLFIIAFITGTFYLRTSSLRKQRRLLAEKVEERTRNLNEKNALLKKQSEDLVKTNALLHRNQDIIKTQSEELKTIADNLEKTNKELEEINATKDKLFSIVAHDLKNPFNVILGYTDVLINNFGSWEDNQKLEMLQSVKESSTNAYNLLENLLNWSRSQRGTLEFEPSAANASEYVRQVLQEVVSFAKKKGVILVNRMNSDKLEIYADPNMLTLICRNLLMNAIKFTKPGKHVYIDSKNFNSEFVLFSVEDEGIGIPREKMDRLFNAENTIVTQGTSGEKGTGLGLILCKEFVSQHGGKIWVESQPGKGTTFFFTIPKS